jgi:hypothetical protein
MSDNALVLLALKHYWVHDGLVDLCFCFPAALLCKGLAGNTIIPQEVCFQLVLLWLPLLCTATHGGDGPIFNSVEKGDAESQLQRLVAALPEPDQEQILSSWLQEYAMSQSNWPNLQTCYNSWCCSVRKLEVGMPKVMEKWLKRHLYTIQ